MLFKRMDSEYIKLCAINDVLDELTNGDEKQKIHPSYEKDEEDKETKEKKKVLVPDKGIESAEDGSWKVSKEYLKYYSKETSIDYSVVFTLIKTLYESRNEVQTSPEDKTPVDLSNLIDNTQVKSSQDVQIEALKVMALKFYTSIFPDEGQPGATEFSKRTLNKVKKIIYPETYGFDEEYGELYIFTDDKLNTGVTGGSNREVEFADGTTKHMVLLHLEKDKNGEPMPTFQKLYTLVHEISHSLGSINGKNTRISNMLGESESMIMESLFSKFLLDNDDIQIPDKEKRVLNYEHGTSRVRTAGEVLNVYKLGAKFYQRKQEESQGQDVYIDYEDEKTMDAVFLDALGREARPDEKKGILTELEFYKNWDEKHIFNNYFSHRYQIGNLIAPYIVNTYLANPQLGRQYIDNFWSTVYEENPDGSEHTIPETFKSIGIEGDIGLKRVVDEYNEWITLANNGETDKLFGSKYITEDELGSQVLEDIKNITETDRVSYEIAKQQRIIDQTKEIQNIGE